MKTKNILNKFRLDPILFSGIILLFGISFIVVYSANPNMIIVKRHAIRVIFALALMAFFAQIPPRLLKNWSIWFYLLSLILLILVLFVGHRTKGAQRWLNLGLIRFQPAELMKLAVPILAASYMHTCALPPRIKEIIIPLTIIAIPFLLIALQPDLGTAILIATSGLFVIYFSGISWRTIITSGILFLSLLPIMWFLLHDYQKQRVMTLLNPERDPFGAGYHIIQSKIAIGSGGLYGKGWMNGTQAHLDFLPERTTDFIFAVFSEEFGLIGIIALLTIYSLILIRGLYISIQAQDTFCKLLAGSLTMTFFICIFVNIGMVSGILPVVGIPLPLISYGGSSLITIMISFGIIMSIGNSKSLVKK